MNIRTILALIAALFICKKSQAEEENIHPYGRPPSNGRLYITAYYTSTLSDFKLPLPGGKKWLLTAEAGGKSYDGVPTNTHSGHQFYSLDFAPKTESNGRMRSESRVPVLAIGDGIVYEVGNDRKYNGNYVRIDHDGDGDPHTGFQSVYLHMADKSVKVRVGDCVRQGKQLGIMGNTGMAYGTHLHLTIYYEGKAKTQLKKVEIDDRLITDYKVGTVSRPKYYRSTNDR